MDREVLHQGRLADLERTSIVKYVAVRSMRLAGVPTLVSVAGRARESHRGFLRSHARSVAGCTNRALANLTGLLVLGAVETITGVTGRRRCARYVERRFTFLDVAAMHAFAPLHARLRGRVGIRPLSTARCVVARFLGLRPQQRYTKAPTALSLAGMPTQISIPGACKWLPLNSGSNRQSQSVLDMGYSMAWTSSIWRST